MSTDNHTQRDAAAAGGRRAPSLIILGIAALAVAGWGLADGPTLPDLDILAWIAVIVAVTAGLFLIISGARSGRR